MKLIANTPVRIKGVELGNAARQTLENMAHGTGGRRGATITVRPTTVLDGPQIINPDTGKHATSRQMPATLVTVSREARPATTVFGRAWNEVARVLSKKDSSVWPGTPTDKQIVDTAKQAKARLDKGA